MAEENKAAAGHTPGPWHVGVGGNFHENRVWTAAMRPVVNLCSFSGSPADCCAVAQANGLLIAAAPDLLAALQQVLAAMEDQSPAAYAPAESVVRAAIAKATGARNV